VFTVYYPTGAPLGERTMNVVRRGPQEHVIRRIDFHDSLGFPGFQLCLDQEHQKTSARNFLHKAKKFIHNAQIILHCGKP
jgi:hypothetical protein